MNYEFTIRNQQLALVAGLALLLHACHASPFSPVVSSAAEGAIQYEFASFYAEVAGDFANPIEADAPSQYVWTTEEASIAAGDISRIYEHVGLTTPDTNSMNEIEIQMVTHLYGQGWQLAHFNNYSVRSNRQDIQTVYRYLFKRPR